MDKNLKPKLNEIIELVEGLSEPYKSISFKEILRKELSHYYDASNEKNLPLTSGDRVNRNKGLVNKWEADLLRDLPEAYKIAENGTRDQQTMWGVITLHGRGEEPNNDSIRKILRDELGIPPQSRSNTARTLRNLTPKYLSREKDGKTYLYKPNRNSINIFEGLTS